MMAPVDTRRVSYLTACWMLARSSGLGATISYPIVKAFQYWDRNFSTDYTSLFIDLVDNYNQRPEYIFISASSPDDNVTGYTLPLMESSFMKHVYGLTSLDRYLKENKPAGVTDAQISTLLSFY